MSNNLALNIEKIKKEKSGIDVILSGKITCPKCSHQFLSNENITISESRELAEGFARQFIQLKLEAKKSSKLRGK